MHNNYIKYFLLFLSILVIAAVDFYFIPSVSVIALYSAPLVVAGLYFSKRIANLVGIVSWILGLLAEINYLNELQLIYRYIAIAILFMIIRYLCILSYENRIKISNQNKELEQKSKEQEHLIMNILEAFTVAIEIKNIYLKGHSKKVAEISKSIATQLGLSADEIHKIYIAGLLHDIGKIGISEKILNKPSKLSKEEYAIIKEHVSMGAAIVSQVNEFKELVKFIKYHHERWDGQGYPQGLAGDEIPLGARIICVADSYDAMLSNRSYRNMFSHQEAIIEIKKCSGTQYDPRVVKVFVGMLNDRKYA